MTRWCVNGAELRCTECTRSGAVRGAGLRQIVVDGDPMVTVVLDLSRALQDRRSRRRRFLFFRGLEYLHDQLERHHVDGIVVGRAAELANLRGGRVAERDTQSAANAEVGPDGADHAAIPILLFDDAAGDGTGDLTDRARKRAEAAIRVDYRYRLRGLLARPSHHLGPHFCPGGPAPRYRASACGGPIAPRRSGALCARLYATFHAFRFRSVSRDAIKIALGIDRCHAPGSSRGDRLPVD